MKPHLKVPRGGDLPAPLRCRALAARCSFSLRAGTITFRAVLWGSPFHSRALELVAWFVRSGEGPSLVFKLFYMNTLHLFSHCGDAPADQTCCVQQRRLRERSGFDAELMTWTLQLPTGGWEQHLNIQTLNILSFQEESLWGSDCGPSVSLSVGLCTRHRCARGCWLTDLLFVLLEWALVVLPGGFFVLWVVVWNIQLLKKKKRAKKEHCVVCLLKIRRGGLNRD